MTSPIDSKVVPFGEAVDTLRKFLRDEGEVELGPESMPTLRNLIGSIRQASVERDEILNHYLAQLVDVTTMPLDMGSIADPIITNQLDLGTL